MKDLSWFLNIIKIKEIIYVLDKSIRINILFYFLILRIKYLLFEHTNSSKYFYLIFMFLPKNQINLNQYYLLKMIKHLAILLIALLLATLGHSIRIQKDHFQFLQDNKFSEDELNLLESMMDKEFLEHMI